MEQKVHSFNFYLDTKEIDLKLSQKITLLIRNYYIEDTP